MVLACARAGAEVIVPGRIAAKLAPVVAELSALVAASRFHAIAANLTDRAAVTARAAVTRLIAEAIAWRGYLNSLVNNAGSIRRAPASGRRCQ